MIQVGQRPRFAPTVLMGLQNWDPQTELVPPVCAPTGGVCLPACPGLATATASAPSLRLTKPSPGYPKGKRFEYMGPGGSPPGMVVSASSAPGITESLPMGTSKFTGTLAGRISLKDVQVGDKTCSSSTPRWTATKKHERKEHKR